MITIAEIKSMTFEQQKDYAQSLRPAIFSYLEHAGYNAGTRERPRNIACPVCGNGTNTPCAGVDPSSCILKCFSCGAWIDVVGISQKLHGGSFEEAIIDVANTTGCPLIIVPGIQQNKPPRVKPTEFELPLPSWSAAATDYVSVCIKHLWDPVLGEAARAYMIGSRKLTADTLKHFQIGYDPAIDCVTLPTFLPWNGSETLVRVQRRRLNPGEGESKYMQLRGSVASVPFNADALLHDPYVVMVEGEIEVMTLWQTARDLIAPVTYGSSNTTPDAVVWRDFLKCPDVICICGDNDDPGREADAKIYKSIRRLKNIRCWNGEDRTDERHVFRASLPDGVNDWNEYYTRGGNVHKLIETMLAGKA